MYVNEHEIYQMYDLNGKNFNAIHVDMMHAYHDIYWFPKKKKNVKLKIMRNLNMDNISQQ